MKKIKCVSLILFLTLLVGCSNKSPVTKTISLKDYQIPVIEKAIKLVSKKTDYGNGMKTFGYDEVPAEYGYDIKWDYNSGTNLINLFSDDDTIVKNLLESAKIKGNEKRIIYLTELEDLYWDWILNSSKNYSIEISTDKVNEGDTFTVSLALTENGKASAEKLGYKFTDTTVEYQVKDGKLVQK